MGQGLGWENHDYIMDYGNDNKHVGNEKIYEIE